MLTPEQLQVCFEDRISLRHEKRPDVAYILLGTTEAKWEGEWYIGWSYMDVKTKKSYWRLPSDFSKFTAPKLGV